MGEFDPIDEEYVYQYNNVLDVERMISASSFLIGEHDFRAFTSLDYEKNCVRTIYDIKFSLDDNILSIDFIGSGFLKYMVRNIVGTLIEVGSLKRSVESVKDVLDGLDRKNAGICAESCGLYLVSVNYY